jgi:signal transduction histidine kinase
MESNSSKGLWAIIIIALGLVTVILVLGNQSFRATEKAAFDEFNQRQLVLARGAASGIELYFETLAGDLRALGRMPEVQHLEEALTRREIQHTFDKLEPLGVNDVGVLDADGLLRYNATAPQIEGQDFSWRRYYQETQQMASAESYVIEFVEFRGAEAGQTGVLVAVPMYETAANKDYPTPSGRFAGVVLCTLRLDAITQRFVAPIQSSRRGRAFLLDDEHTVLWSPDRSLFGKNLLEQAEDFPAFQQVIEGMRTGDPGTAEYTYYRFGDSIDEDAGGGYTKDEREEKLIAYAPIHLGDELWAIGVWSPKEDARLLIRSAYRVQLLVVGSSILIVLFGSVYALSASSRVSKLWEQEAQTKTGELEASHERLVEVLGNLEAAHAFQQSILDGVTEPIMVIGTDYRVQLMNRAAREFSSASAGGPEAILCYRISHRRETPCEGTEHPCPLERVRESGQPVTVVHEHHRADGERRLVEVIASPLWGENGALQGIIESVHDVTERVRAEDALRRRADELAALQATLINAQEAERKRISLELHDEMGQSLTAIGINLEEIDRELSSQLSLPIKERLAETIQLNDRTLDQVRELALGLRPSLLDDLGLVPALRWYVNRYAKRLGIEVELETIHFEERAASETETVLYRVVQEALTNVARHAEASRVRVRLARHESTIAVTIEDDGKGFDRQAIGAERGTGLLGIQERVALLGGSSDIQSSPGQGTRLSAEIPWRDRS